MNNLSSQIKTAPGAFQRRGVSLYPVRRQRMTLIEQLELARWQDSKTLLVPSATRDGLFYRTTFLGCSCPARRRCHHRTILNAMCEMRLRKLTVEQVKRNLEKGCNDLSCLFCLSGRHCPRQVTRSELEYLIQKSFNEA